MQALLPRSLKRPALLPTRCSQPTRCPHLIVHTRRRAVSVAHVSEADQLGKQLAPPEENSAPVVTSESLLYVDPVLEEELEILELDQAQESLLKWMLLDATEQEQDLDEMIDYDEFGDDEYADMYEEVEELLDAVDYTLHVGDTVEGTVVEVEDDGAYVEIGAKSIAFCPITECSFARLKTPLEALRRGMVREFVVVGDEKQYGQFIISIAAMEATAAWARMRQLLDEDVAVHVRVESVNRGGMLVRYGHFDGFVPVSQLGPSITPDTMPDLIGTEIPVKFSEIDEDKERLVFSHKRACRSGPRAASRGLQVGNLVVGVVQTVKPYGAFVDLGGGVTGLLHISQVSADRVLMLDRLLSEGDRLKVMVLSLEAATNRVTLTTKKLEPTPGDMIRDPKLVFEKAEEMAALFKQRLVSAAESGVSAAEAEAGLGLQEEQQPFVY